MSAVPYELVPIDLGWKLWPCFRLRSAGFPVSLLGHLSGQDLSAQHESLAALLHEPRFREVLIWQNRAALQHITSHIAKGKPRNQDWTFLANYLQRLCMKNDTIGFFGPMGWAELD